MYRFIAFAAAFLGGALLLFNIYPVAWGVASPMALKIISVEGVDKSFFLLLTFVATAKGKEMQVFLGAFIGLFLNALLVALVGAAMIQLVPDYVVKGFSALILAAVAVHLFGLEFIPEPTTDEKTWYKRLEEWLKSKPLALQIGLLIFILEMGDLTQINVATTAAGFGSAYSVMVGTAIGFMATCALGAFAGAAFQRSLEKVGIGEKGMKKIAGGVCAAFALYFALVAFGVLS